MVEFNNLEWDEVVPKIINKNCTFRNKGAYNNQNKFHYF